MPVFKHYPIIGDIDMEITPLSTPETVLKEYGQRLKSHIKTSPDSQDSLAKAAGVGVATLRRMVAGNDATLSNWIKVLSALDLHIQVENFVPAKAASPLEEVGHKKSRASINPGQSFKWGDEQ